MRSRLKAKVIFNRPTEKSVSSAQTRPADNAGLIAHQGEYGRDLRPTQAFSLQRCHQEPYGPSDTELGPGPLLVPLLALAWL